MTTATTSGLTCERPALSAGVPIDGSVIDVGVTRNGYVHKVRIGGSWYFIEALSSEFAAALQQAYEEMSE